MPKALGADAGIHLVLGCVQLWTGDQGHCQCLQYEAEPNRLQKDEERYCNRLHGRVYCYQMAEVDTANTKGQTMYYTTEKDNAASYRKWEQTNATTLSGAKRVARRRQTFAGTCIAVGVDSGLTLEHGDGETVILQVAHTLCGEWISDCD